VVLSQYKNEERGECRQEEEATHPERGGSSKKRTGTLSVDPVGRFSRMNDGVSSASGSTTSAGKNG